MSESAFDVEEEDIAALSSFVNQASYFAATILEKVTDHSILAQNGRQKMDEERKREERVLLSVCLDSGLWTLDLPHSYDKIVHLADEELAIGR